MSRFKLETAIKEELQAFVTGFWKVSLNISEQSLIRQLPFPNILFHTHTPKHVVTFKVIWVYCHLCGSVNFTYGSLFNSYTSWSRAKEGLRQRLNHTSLPSWWLFLLGHSPKVSPSVYTKWALSHSVWGSQDWREGLAKEHWGAYMVYLFSCEWGEKEFAQSASS